MFFFADLTRPADLNMLSKDRLIAFLRSDHPDRAALWNTWRREGDWDILAWQEADLSGADLRGLTLSLLDLTRADLSDARLDGAQFNGTLLRGANLSGASLAGASLREADLTSASLRGADLRGVDLSGVKRLAGAAWLDAKLDETTALDARLILESPIGEEAAGRLSEAVEAYRALRRACESRDDFKSADRLFAAQKRAETLMRLLPPLRRLYPRRRFDDSFCQPHLLRWLGLALAGAVAGHGTSLLRPILGLVGVFLLFALIYLAGGLITDAPGCGFLEYNITGRLDCLPSRGLLDALQFSLGSLTPGGTGVVQPYLSHVWLLQTVEAVLGMILLGVFGYALGRRLHR